MGANQNELAAADDNADNLSKPFLAVSTCLNSGHEIWSRTGKEYSSSLFSSAKEEEIPPGLLSVVSSSINIFQDRITRSRLAGDPADVMISPRLRDVGLLEFGKAAEAMQTGEACVQRVMPDIERLIESLQG